MGPQGTWPPPHAPQGPSNLGVESYDHLMTTSIMITHKHRTCITAAQLDVIIIGIYTLYLQSHNDGILQVSRLWSSSQYLIWASPQVFLQTNTTQNLLQSIASKLLQHVQGIWFHIFALLFHQFLDSGAWRVPEKPDQNQLPKSISSAK